jgi:hypothetical protein
MRETGIELAIDEGSATSLPILVSSGRNGPPLSVEYRVISRLGHLVVGGIGDQEDGNDHSPDA